jgi:hypothetical protein
VYLSLSEFALTIVSGGKRMIRGIKFASIPVNDQDKAIAFYTENLDFAS